MWNKLVSSLREENLTTKFWHLFLPKDGSGNFFVTTRSWRISWPMGSICCQIAACNSLVIIIQPLIFSKLNSEYLSKFDHKIFSFKFYQNFISLHIQIESILFGNLYHLHRCLYFMNDYRLRIDTQVDQKVWRKLSKFVNDFSSKLLDRLQ